MRRWMRNTAGALAAAFALAATASAEPPVRKLDAHFAALAGHRRFNGNVLVAEAGKILYERSFGYSDFPSRRRNTRQTPFPLASVTKLLTATGILQLFETGRLGLDDPVARHLPEFPYPEITVRHLLSHTSGLPPYNAFFDSAKAADPDKIFTNDDFLPGLSAHPRPLLYRPGTQANYDNINFLVLALVIERASGEPFHDYLLAHVLRPAGMSGTRPRLFSEQFDPAAKRAGSFATPHLFLHPYDDEPVRADRIAYVASYWRAYRFLGFGEYVSTTHDLLRFDRALADGRLVSQAVLKEAYSPRRLADGSEHPLGCGLGWMREKDDSLGTIVYHEGGAIGLSCVLSRNLTRRQTVILFDVAQAGAAGIARDVFRILAGRDVPLPRISAARLYGKSLVGDDPEAANELLGSLAADGKRYELNESELNALGYDFMAASDPFHLAGKPRYDLALRVFQTNIRLFPESWNAYDSCGEALLNMGRRQEAAVMYRKSLQLNPANENGKRILEKLEEADKIGRPGAAMGTAP